MSHVFEDKKKDYFEINQIKKLANDKQKNCVRK